MVQLKNLPVPAPEMFAKFANFTVIATLTREHVRAPSGQS
jgi:hypothetical protein